MFKIVGLSKKVLAAHQLLNECTGDGLISSGLDRFEGVCLTRDMAYEIAPLLHEIGEHEQVREYLEKLNELRVNFPLTPAYISAKTVDKGDDWHSPYTYWNDVEICYLLLMYRYTEATGDRDLLKKYRFNVDSAWDRVNGRGQLSNGEGLFCGVDWRRMMAESLKNQTPTLTNNALLLECYRLRKDQGRFAALQRGVSGELTRSDLGYKDTDDYDANPLGDALLTLLGEGHTRPDLFVSLMTEVDSTHGVKVQRSNRFSPMTNENPLEVEAMRRLEGSAVCPFVISNVIRAALKVGARELAQEQFKKLSELEGFQEWYDPTTGKGYGSEKYLLSAASYLRAFHAMQRANAL
jgi:hypothetical protein